MKLRSFLLVTLFALGACATAQRSLTYPAGGGAFTLLPGDTVLTAAGGLASVQVRLVNRALPDSAVVEARAVRANGQTVPGSPVTFVVEFQP